MGSKESSTIVLMGGYGGGNFGDEAICFVTSKLIKELCPNAHLIIFTFNCSVSEKIVTTNVTWREYKTIPFTLPWFRHFGFLNLVSSMQTLQALRSADHILLGGGGLLYDYDLKHLLGWASRALLIRLIGKRYSFYMNSFTPPQKILGKLLTRWMIKNAEKISVRDNSSAEFCKANDRPDARVSLDPAFLLPNYFRETLHPVKKEQKIILAPRPWGEEDRNIIAWSRLINHLSKNYPQYSIVLLALDPRMDKALCKKIEGLNLKVSKIVDIDYYDFSKFIHEFSSASLVIAMRLHAAILSISLAVKTIGIAYDRKFFGIFRLIDASNFCISWDDFVADSAVSKSVTMAIESEQATVRNDGVSNGFIEMVKWHLQKENV